MKNKKSIIATSSSTYAMKGAKLLSEYGISSRVIRLRADRTKNGCAYGISVNAENREESARILLDGRVRYTEIIDE